MKLSCCCCCFTSIGLDLCKSLKTECVKLYFRILLTEKIEGNFRSFYDSKRENFCNCLLRSFHPFQRNQNPRTRQKSLVYFWEQLFVLNRLYFQLAFSKDFVFFHFRVTLLSFDSKGTMWNGMITLWGLKLNELRTGCFLSFVPPLDDFCVLSSFLFCLDPFSFFPVANNQFIR